MAAQKRKKTSRAERKVKTQKRQAQLKTTQGTKADASAASAFKQLPFEQIAAQAGERKIVLQLGCRIPQANRLHQVFKGDNWFEIRLDKNPLAQPHILSDMNDLSLIPNESVDAVYTTHNLDSLKTTEIPALFEEIRRILKWGGQFVMAVPDMQTICNYVAHNQLLEPIYDSTAGPVAPIDMIYGFRPKLENGTANVRQTGFTAKSLATYFREASYSNIVVGRKWIEIWATAYKYKEGDERRKDVVEMRATDEVRDQDMPKPLPLNRVPHPGQFAANMLSDELDIPPKYWKPIGIAKK